MYALETTHAANAPLMVGKPGSAAFDKCVAFLKRVIRPGTPTAEVKAESDIFKLLMARAKNTNAKL